MKRYPYWLNKRHMEAVELAKMSDEQLNHPGTLPLLNDLTQNAHLAYNRQIDALTSKMHRGISWIYNTVQTLAVLDITSYTSKGV
ncbi:MAG: hypothetical protein NVS2B2_10570 [Ktedonobacteraceae bacterium]